MRSTYVYILYMSDHDSMHGAYNSHAMVVARFLASYDASRASDYSGAGCVWLVDCPLFDKCVVQDHGLEPGTLLGTNACHIIMSCIYFC